MLVTKGDQIAASLVIQY